MSSYGPPGPDQPEDPYRRPASAPPGGSSTPDQPETAPLPPRPPAGPYAPPPSGDPYPPPSAGGSYPSSPPPGAPYCGGPGPYGPGTPYGPGGPYGPPPGPAKGNGLKIGLIIGAVVLLLLCICGVLAIWVTTQIDTSSDGDAAEPPRTRPTFATGVEPTLKPPGLEPEFVPGDCLVNDGTDSIPELRKVPCGPGTFEVILRIPMSTQSGICELLAVGSDAEYTYDSPLTSTDYVLCLRKR